MIIKCDACGIVYDTNENFVCPNCKKVPNEETMDRHIDLQNNIQEQRTLNMLERERLQNEKESLENERIKNRIKREKSAHRTSKFMSLGCGLPVFLFICFIAFCIIFGVFNGLKQDGAFTEIQEQMSQEMEDLTEESIQDTKQIVNLNEFANTSKYSVMCTEYEKIEDTYPWPVDEGKEWYSFKLTIQNNSDKTIFMLEDIICVVDGYQCQRVNMRGDLHKQPDVASGEKIQGTVVFEIPEDAKNITIKYGEYAEINIIK